MIADYLFKGKEHARTGQELAAAVGCSMREGRKGTQTRAADYSKLRPGATRLFFSRNGRRTAAVLQPATPPGGRDSQDPARAA